MFEMVPQVSYYYHAWKSLSLLFFHLAASSLQQIMNVTWPITITATWTIPKIMKTSSNNNSVDCMAFALSIS